VTPAGFAPDIAVTVLVAAGLLVPVRVPWGGSVPMGAAAAVAGVALLSLPHSAGALAAALLLGWFAQRRLGRGFDVVRAVAGACGAIAGAALVDAVVDGDLPVLAAAVGAAGGLIVGDLLANRFEPSRERIEVRSALPVHLTLACAGVLVAVAVDRVGVAMAAVAAFPLLITRFSFDRYAGATDTLDQTVQALGLVPELAGIAPLGHSERSAVYAAAIARELGFDRARAARVVTATRLHHIGAVPFDPDGELAADMTPNDVAAQGAQILREANLPGDVAELLESAGADALDAVSPTLDAAVVRVASTFDDIVGDDVAAADRGLAIVSAAVRDPHSRRAAAALLELAATTATLVADAVAAGDRFRDAAVGLDLESITMPRAGAAELLPFTRRG
jgi:hypothetical protein